MSAQFSVAQMPGESFDRDEPTLGEESLLFGVVQRRADHPKTAHARKSLRPFTVSGVLVMKPSLPRINRMPVTSGHAFSSM